jgi:hypothetical protein
LRELIPTVDCDEVLALKPTDCRRCDTKLTGIDSAPLRHHVAELPEFRLHVTEF